MEAKKRGMEGEEERREWEKRGRKTFLIPWGSICSNIPLLAINPGSSSPVQEVWVKGRPRFLKPGCLTTRSEALPSV